MRNHSPLVSRYASPRGGDLAISRDHARTSMLSLTSRRIITSRKAMQLRALRDHDAPNDAIMRIQRNRVRQTAKSRRVLAFMKFVAETRRLKPASNFLDRASSPMEAHFAAAAPRRKTLRTSAKVINARYSAEAERTGAGARSAR